MIFLDSSFLIALFNLKDEHRNKTLKLMPEIINGKYGEALISDYIFDEIVTVVFSRNKKLSIAVDAGNKIKDSVKIIGIDKELFEKSWDIFRNQRKTKFSFTDCSILAVMEREGIEYIATFDDDFKKINWIKVA